MINILISTLLWHSTGNRLHGKKIMLVSSRGWSVKISKSCCGPKGSDDWHLQRIQKAYCKLLDKHISVLLGSFKTSHVDDMISLQHLNIDENSMLFVNDQPQLFMDNKMVEMKPVKSRINAASYNLLKMSPTFSAGLK